MKILVGPARLSDAAAPMLSVHRLYVPAGMVHVPLTVSERSADVHVRPTPVDRSALSVSASDGQGEMGGRSNGVARTSRGGLVGLTPLTSVVVAPEGYASGHVPPPPQPTSAR